MSKEEPDRIYFGNRANAHLALEQYDQCIQDCDQAIALDPDYVKAYYRKARALFDQGKAVEASEACYYALTLDAESNELRTL